MEEKIEQYIERLNGFNGFDWAPYRKMLEDLHLSRSEASVSVEEMFNHRLSLKVCGKAFYVREKLKPVALKIYCGSFTLNEYNEDIVQRIILNASRALMEKYPEEGIDFHVFRNQIRTHVRKADHE